VLSAGKKTKFSWGGKEGWGFSFGGMVPKPEDKCMVHFSATTINGVEFDASSPKGSEKLVAVKPKEVPLYSLCACVHACVNTRHNTARTHTCVCVCARVIQREAAVAHVR
jgi:hypothetical protein